MSVKVGRPVPDTEVEAYVRGKADPVKLKLLTPDKWVVLFFYPRDFTTVCPTEIESFGRLDPQFQKAGAVLFGASTDSYFSHKAWFESDARLKGVHFPVIGDTSHHLTAAFDLLVEENGDALRGTFIIDPKGILQHMTVNNMDVGRSVEETLRTLQACQTGALCPVNWHPGQATLGPA